MVWDLGQLLASSGSTIATNGGDPTLDPHQIKLVVTMVAYTGPINRQNSYLACTSRFFSASSNISVSSTSWSVVEPIILINVLTSPLAAQGGKYSFSSA